MNARLAVAGFLSLISAIWLYSFTKRSPTQAFYRPYEQAAIALAIVGLILLAVGLFPEEKKRI